MAKTHSFAITGPTWREAALTPAMRQATGAASAGNPEPRDRAAIRPQPARSGTDWWPTPPCLTAALLRCVLPHLSGPIWEPAAGDGCLADAMRQAGRTVLASDLEPRAPDILTHDFLHAPPPAVAGSALVTNPPFNALDRFINRSLALLDAGFVSAVVLLLRSDALTSARRAAALNRAEREVLCCWRPVWMPGTRGGGRWSNGWITWRAGHTGPPTTLHLRRADLERAGRLL